MTQAKQHGKLNVIFRPCVPTICSLCIFFLYMSSFCSVYYFRLSVPATCSVDRSASTISPVERYRISVAGPFFCISAPSLLRLSGPTILSADLLRLDWPTIGSNYLLRPAYSTVCCDCFFPAILLRHRFLLPVPTIWSNKLIYKPHQFNSSQITSVQVNLIMGSLLYSSFKLLDMIKLKQKISWKIMGGTRLELPPFFRGIL